MKKDNKNETHYLNMFAMEKLGIYYWRKNVVFEKTQAN